MKNLLAERARPSTPAQHFFDIAGIIHGSALATCVFRFAFYLPLGAKITWPRMRRTGVKVWSHSRVIPNNLQTETI
jgi:hypothetical protein